MRNALRRLIALARAASAYLRYALAVALLVIVYVTVVPVLALVRARSARPRGWRMRDDRDVGTLARLRRPW